MEFREMRRFRQQLTRQECEGVLAQETSGVLAVTGDGGWPYAVPLSYAYEEGKLLFHCAKAGHKLDALRQEPRASFCVIHQDQVVPQEFTTYYQSVIAFGTIRLLSDEAEKMAAIEKLALKYTPHAAAQKQAEEIKRFFPALCMMELTITHLTGKKAKEL